MTPIKYKFLVEFFDREDGRKRADVIEAVSFSEAVKRAIDEAEHDGLYCAHKIVISERGF